MEETEGRMEETEEQTVETEEQTESIRWHLLGYGSCCT